MALTLHFQRGTQSLQIVGAVGQGSQSSLPACPRTLDPTALLGALSNSLLT